MKHLALASYQIGRVTLLSSSQLASWLPWEKEPFTFCLLGQTKKNKQQGSPNNGANEKKEVVGIGLWEWLMNGTKEFVRVFSLITSFIFHMFHAQFHPVAQLVNDLAQLEACEHVSLIMMGVVPMLLLGSIQFRETLLRLWKQSRPPFSIQVWELLIIDCIATVQKVTQALAI